MSRYDARLLFLVLFASALSQQSSLATAPGSALPGQGKPELVLQYAQSDRAMDVAFAASAPVFASSSGNGQIDIWDTRTWQLQRSIDTEDQSSSRNYNTKGIALSPDGSRLAYTIDTGEVQLWSTTSGKLVRKLAEPVGLPVGVQWSPDGRRIAAGGVDAVRVWDAASGRVVRSFPATGDVAFSRDGKILGAAGESSAFLFDIASGRKIRSFADKAGVSGPIAISADGRYVATGGEDPDWDPGPLPRDENGNAYAPTESYYAHHLKVKIWDARTGRRVRMLPGHYNLNGGTQVLQFSPDGRKLFSGSGGSAELWYVNSGKLIRRFQNNDACAMSPDGKMIAASYGELRVYSVATGKNLAKVHNPPFPVRSLAFSRDGRVLAEGDQWIEKTGFRLWDVERGQLSRALAGPPPDLQSVGFVGDNQMFSNSFNGTYIWDRRSGKLVQKIADPGKRWTLMTPDGSKIVNQAGGSFADTYVVRSREAGKLISKIASRGQWMEGEPLSPDGRFMLTHGYVTFSPPLDTVYVWDLNTGMKVSELSDLEDGALVMVFSPDGKKIAGCTVSFEETAGSTPDDSYKMVIWEVGTGRVLHRTSLGKDRATTLAFSHDGRILAAGVGSEIRVYDSESLSDTGTITTGKSPVSALAFAPDGGRIAAGYADGRVRLWDARSRSLLITMLGFAPAKGQSVSPDWIAYTPDGRYNWSPGATDLIRWRHNEKLYPANAFAGKLEQANLLR